MASTRRTDPRPYQIAVLSTLLLWGGWTGRIDASATQLAATLAGALCTQWVATQRLALPRFDPRSPIITSLGLTLLLRTTSPWSALLAGALGIGAKFTLRVNNKHVFNPAMLGLVGATWLTSNAWISPGQWGHDTVFAFALASVGLGVVHRSSRSDVTVAFLLAWAGLLFGRATWLGDPWQIPMHQLQSGALVLFAFFMISDPKTTPDARPARIAHAVAVAALAAWLQLVLYRESGVITALFLLSPLVPLLDRLVPGPTYSWVSQNEDAHAPARPAPAPVAAHAA